MAITPTSACTVVGTGPAGLAAALALAEIGADVAVAGPAPPPPQDGDTRTAALFGGSIALLDTLGVWSGLAPLSAPLKAICIVDDTDGLLRAPEVRFDAAEIGLDAFGWNVPNAALAATLWTAVLRHPRIRLVADAPATRIETGETAATVHTADGQAHRTALIVAADGRQSLCRAAAGIATTAWSYDQAAIATRFDHGRPHNDVSTEFHRSAGPLTTVPLPGRASSLVWVERPDVVAQLMRLDDAGFAEALESRLQGLLGRVRAVARRASFPLSGLTAVRLGQNRVALVGEAGHVIPPIGAQGLNLGLRDAAVLADCVAAAMARGEDPGGPETLGRYHSARQADVAGRSLAVDTLNRTLISGLLPVSLLRGLGLHVIRAVPPLKRALIRQGLGPAGPHPTLMQAKARRDESPARSDAPRR